MLLLLIIGSVIGLVLGLTGAGGSVFAVPLLMIFLQLPVQEAMGLALASVALSATYGVLIRWRERHFFITPAILLGSTGVLTAPVGKWVATQTPDILLQILFAAIAVFLGIRMWLQANKQPEATRVVRASTLQSEAAPNYLCRYSQNGHFELKPSCVSGLLFFGLIVGFLSGFLGVGGGFLIIPILLFLSHMPMSMAVGTSLLIIAPVSLSGFVSYYLITPEVDLRSIVLIVAGGVIGMTFGSRLAKVLAGPQLQKIFAASLIILVAFNLGYFVVNH
jgi:hypothetical protein